jgi:hypothetical protein
MSIIGGQADFKSKRRSGLGLIELTAGPHLFRITPV